MSGLRTFSVAVILAGSAIAAQAAVPVSVQVADGNCNIISHTAEGSIGEDLTKRQSKFFCNSAVISFFDESSKHVMVQFSQKHGCSTLPDDE